jgi:predicted N-acetyltransferase YhbS
LKVFPLVEFKVGNDRVLRISGTRFLQVNYSTDEAVSAEELSGFFTDIFSASEGPSEGELIGNLARRLVSETPSEDVWVFIARDGGELTGAIIFSRLRFEQETKTVVVLGPVAVATARHGQGIGQSLIAHGLAELKREGVEIAVTYGDPRFYGKVGFAPVSEADVPAPYPLQYPEGWLAQTLTDLALMPLKGPSHPVKAFEDPAFW